MFTLEVTIKEFNGDVERSFKRGKKIDPFNEKEALLKGIQRIMDNPDITLTFINNTLVNSTIVDGKLVIVKGYTVKGIVPARVPLTIQQQNIPKASSNTLKFFSDEEIGKFYIVPVIAGKKPKLATVEDLAKNVGKRIKVLRVIGNSFGGKIEFELNGITFVGHVNKRGKDFTARDIVKTATAEAIKNLDKLIGEEKIGKAYRILSGDTVKVKGSIEVKNIVFLAENFRLGKELKRTKRKLLSVKLTPGKLRLAVSRFIDEYEAKASEEINDDHVIVKVAGLKGKLPEEKIRVGYAVLSKGKKVVFTSDVEVLNSISVGKNTLSIVEANFGHEFKDTKITGAMPLTVSEFERLKEGVGGYQLEFLRFFLSPS